MVEELAMNAGIPKPKSNFRNSIPNAFCICRTKKRKSMRNRGILKLVDEEELKAVLGHEFSLIRHRDMAVMTLIMWCPYCYWYFISTLFSGDRDVMTDSLVSLPW
jgi:heat shock protein HtpX